MKYRDIPANISGIYKIVFPNGKVYIGRAVNISGRIREHYTKEDNTPCQYAIYKYFHSYLDIEVEIVEQVKYYDERIYELEKKWIKYYNATDRNYGYNITDGGKGGGTGVYNSASKFSKEDLDNIINLLLQKKSNVYIGDLYNVHPDTIGHINQGKRYYNPDLFYPLREGKGEKDYFEKHNCFSKEQIEEVIYLLTTTTLSNKEISKKTKVGTTVISKINTGKHPSCKDKNISFPIRSSRRSKKLSVEELQEIRKQLLDKNLSIEKIAENFNCSRDTITDINQGKTYYDKSISYPIRNFYPNRKKSN